MREWATHTEIWNDSGRKLLLFANEQRSFDPIVFWAHSLPRREGEYAAPRLELVLHEKTIKFWAVGGRFGSRSIIDFCALEEHTLVKISLEAKKLEAHRVRPNEADDQPSKQYEDAWRRQYQWGGVGGEDQRIWWLQTVDLIQYVDRW
jgi:hypothetical protein